MYLNNHKIEGYNEAVREWLEILGDMWIAIGKEVDADRLKIYARQFGSLPGGILQKAVARAIRENGKYQTVPTISALWGAVYKEMGDPSDIDSAVDNWIERSFDRCVIRFQSEEDRIDD